MNACFKNRIPLACQLAGLLWLVGVGGGARALGRGYVAVSDHGPWRGQKSQNYEGGHRVPAIAWWPGRITPGSVSAATVMTMDLLPTFLEVARQPALSGAEASDGIDLSDHLFRGKGLPERTLFWRKNPGKAVRQGTWKLLVDPRGTELFDLATDPGERNNLAGEQPARVRAMLTTLAAWETKVEASARELADSQNN